MRLVDSQPHREFTSYFITRVRATRCTHPTSLRIRNYAGLLLNSRVVLIQCEICRDVILELSLLSDRALLRYWGIERILAMTSQWISTRQVTNPNEIGVWDI